jgi:hypothetical protein
MARNLALLRRRKVSALSTLSGFLQNTLKDNRDFRAGRLPLRVYPAVCARDNTFAYEQLYRLARVAGNSIRVGINETSFHLLFSLIAIIPVCISMFLSPKSNGNLLFSSNIYRWNLDLHVNALPDKYTTSPILSFVTSASESGPSR